MARRQAFDLFLNSVDQSPGGAGTGIDWPGGDGMIIAEATWGGGNVQLQILSRNNTWVNVTYTGNAAVMALTVNGTSIFRAPAGKLRAVITTATAVYCSIVGIPGNVAG